MTTLTPPRSSPRLADAQALAAAERQGFVVITSVFMQSHLDYLAWCREHGRPYVRDREHCSRAYLQLDMEPAGWALDAVALARVDTLAAPLIAAHQNTRVIASPRGVTVLDVPRAEARTLAFRLYELAMDCRP